MNIRLPYSRKRRYLTGMDWIVGAMNDMNRRTTGGTNASQVVMELRGPFELDRFTAAVTDLSALFPVLAGYPARDWNLAPYWRMPRHGVGPGLLVESRQVSESELPSALAEAANAPFAGKRDHVAFRVFRIGNDRHFFAMQFDHRLLDARGAEMFLDLFQRRYQGEDCRARLASLALTEPAHLCHWKRKFDAGRQYVRMFLDLARTPPTVLPRPAPLRGRPYRFHVIRFSADESRAIVNRAYRDAGYLMLMPYSLAAAVQALHRTFKARGLAVRNYVVSVSVDLRTPDKAAANLFFNHVSFLFFKIPAICADDPKATLAGIRTQMYEQIKSSFPRDLAESSMLMRIVPLPLLRRLLLWPMRGEAASFSFSCAGKGDYALSRFMDAEVVNLFHMPLAPVPPGVGFVINQYGGRLNAVLSYVDGLLSPDEVRQIESDTRRLL